jgi:predicted DNA binding CopG/RHH family protein
MKIIRSMDEIPKNMSDSEAAEFWSCHSMSEELLESAIIDEDDEDLPKRKSVSISLRLDDDLLTRIRNLAKAKNKGYQSLIKDFLIERTYEEEKKRTRKVNIVKNLPNAKRYYKAYLEIAATKEE